MVSGSNSEGKDLLFSIPVLTALRHTQPPTESVGTAYPSWGQGGWGVVLTINPSSGVDIKNELELNFYATSMPARYDTW
jgi:hypothetical protein